MTTNYAFAYRNTLGQVKGHYATNLQDLIQQVQLHQCLTTYSDHEASIIRFPSEGKPQMGMMGRQYQGYKSFR